MQQIGETGGLTYARGSWRFDSLDVPNNSVGSANFKSTDPLVTDKQYHKYAKQFSQARGSAISGTTGTGIHIALATGTLVGLKAQIAVAPSSWAGGGQAVVDLLKNGTTVLSGTITIDGSSVINTTYVGTISTASYAVGDRFEVKVTFTAGTGTPAQGLTVEATFEELDGD